jgi:ketosteroid isomerase-like protein
MTADGKATAEVRARIEDWAAALRAKDIDGIMASHSADVLAFDCHRSWSSRARTLIVGISKHACLACRGRCSSRFMT